MELELVLLGQVAIGLVLCLPTLIAATARFPSGIGAARSRRPQRIMGRSKYAFYTL